MGFAFVGTGACEAAGGAGSFGAAGGGGRSAGAAAATDELHGFEKFDEDTDKVNDYYHDNHPSNCRWGNTCAPCWPAQAYPIAMQ